jgi:hypothetical protein
VLCCNNRSLAWPPVVNEDQDLIGTPQDCFTVYGHGCNAQIVLLLLSKLLRNTIDSSFAISMQLLYNSLLKGGNEELLHITRSSRRRYAPSTNPWQKFRTLTIIPHHKAARGVATNFLIETAKVLNGLEGVFVDSSC